MRNLCIITARGGSKRIPRKNIKLFNGKPIIAYTIETALSSDLFDEVMVSTDDIEIAEIAKQYGATLPFFRSEENADDYSGTVDVLLEVITEYQQLQREFDNICCLYPTAPFVTVDLLKKGYEKLINGQFHSVYPIQKFSFPIQRAVSIVDNRVRWFDEQSAQKRSQDLPEAYHDAGQFYWCNCQGLLTTKQIVTDNSSYLLIDEMQAQDIDNLEDWAVAEFKYHYLHHGTHN